MDYLLNRYLFAYLPFELSEEWKKSITTAGMSTIKVYIMESNDKTKILGG